MYKLIGSSALGIIFIQGINFLTPIIALPHIARALGVDTFGLYAIALTYGNYIVLFTDFSFNVNGPIRVAESLRAGQLRTLILDSTLLRGLMAVPACIAYTIAITVVAKGSIEFVLCGLAIPIATVFTPRWLMYGLNQLYAFAIFCLVTKGLWLLSVYLFVTSPSDLALLLLSTAGAQVALGILCYFTISRGAGGERLPSFSRARKLFVRDFNQFAALIAVASLRDLAVVLISVVAAPAAVALYTLADRVRFATLGVVAPLTQSLFLVSARLSADPDGPALSQRVRGVTNSAILAGALLCGLVISTESRRIVLLLGGEHFAGAAPLLAIIAFAPAFSGLTSILGVNTLLRLGYGDDYARMQLWTVAIAAPLLISLVYTLGIYGAAAGALIAEALGAALMLVACIRRGVLHEVFSFR